MARVNQFAKDLGINYNQAKNLINEGRSRKDGGSQILEKTMKPIKAKDGKYNKVAKPKKKPKNFKKIVNKIKMEKAIEKGQATVGDFNEMTEYDRKQFLKGNKKGTFKDLSGDNKITMKDVLIGRGVLEKPQEKADGGTMRKKMGARRTPSVRKNEPKEILTPFKGVLKTSKGEKLRNVDGKTFLVKPNPKFNKPRMRRMKDGGVFRGCGAQVKGKKFKGVF